MSYPCPAENCVKEYNTEQGLNYHIGQCKEYAKELSEPRSEGKGRKRRKKKSRKERDVEFTAGPSRIPTAVNPSPGPSSGTSPPSPLEQPMDVDEDEQMVVDSASVNDPDWEDIRDKRTTVNAPRTGRKHAVPARYKDFVAGRGTKVPSIIPEGMVESNTKPQPQPAPAPPPPDNAPESPAPVKYGKTETNVFGIFRIWAKHPFATPPRDEDGLRSDACTFAKRGSDRKANWWAGFGRLKSGLDPKTIAANICAPFANSSIFRLVQHYYQTIQDTSASSFTWFVRNVLKADDFRLSDIPDDFDLAKELKKLDTMDEDDSPFAHAAHWKEATLNIPLPAEKVKHKSEASAPKLKVEGVLFRDLVEVIKSAFQGPESINYHYTPAKAFYKPEGAEKPERIYSEIYESDEFWAEHEAIMASLPEDKRDLPIAVAALMFYSDATHLANFGTASLWPLYLFFGNQSKYDRAKPSNYAAHHLAYIPKLPQDLQDQYKKAYDGMVASDPVISQLRRELVQGVWDLILSDAFVEAFKDGLVVTCSDGVTRRIFPRFFTYSADYPEKTILTGVRPLAKCGCPSCLTPMNKWNELGTTNDDRRRAHLRKDDEAYRKRIERSRVYMFQHGCGPKSQYIQNLLDERSEAPSRNAFSRAFSYLKFNFFSMFVPDLLHEFELGVWKSVKTHLMRIFEAAEGDQVQELNERYRLIPTFGRNTIRKFRNNMSAMKKLAARDFEDMLQCSLPIFDSLLPEHNTVILDFLFVLCCWHALGKLRLHTQTSVSMLKTVTRGVGMHARRFRSKVCSAYNTRDLPSEDAARSRRRQKKGKTEQAPVKKRTFNLNTFKFHSLGHYISTILSFGTTDSYSTQMGEQEHRRVKRFYTRTNKMRSFGRQIARHVRRQRLLQAISRRYEESKLRPKSDEGGTVPAPQAEPLGPPQLESRYQMSKSNFFPLPVETWLEKHEGDPAIINFYDDLRSHILARLTLPREQRSDAKFSTEDLSRIVLLKHSIYRHKVLRIYYTTYDMRREWDSINPRSTHCDIMLLACENDDSEGFQPHPYWYARVVGVFHADVSLLDDDGEEMKRCRVDFLWVRWFGRVAGGTTFEEGRLQQCGFIDTDLENSGAFGFVDPADVVRGAHMIPAFAEGRTDEFMGPSMVRHARENDTDYRFYNVNPFADQDMFMRFVGGAPGHGPPLPYYPLKPLSLYAPKPKERKARRRTRSTGNAASSESEAESEELIEESRAQDVLSEDEDEWSDVRSESGSSEEDTSGRDEEILDPDDEYRSDELADEEVENEPDTRGYKF